MDAIYVGIDVSKDRLDVHVVPSGQAFAVARDGKGLSELIEQLSSICPRLIAVDRRLRDDRGGGDCGRAFAIDRGQPGAGASLRASDR